MTKRKRPASALEGARGGPARTGTNRSPHSLPHDSPIIPNGVKRGITQDFPPTCDPASLALAQELAKLPSAELAKQAKLLARAPLRLLPLIATRMRLLLWEISCRLEVHNDAA